jgi:hypothetical protein
MLQIVLVLLTALNAPVAPHNNNYLVKGAGGPDAYGYRWIDNDTTGPTNVPTFSWKDISTAGTRVRGLADDNVVGPFPIGFNFPYYWYRVNSFYIGSNGYIAFGDNGMAASPFSSLPNPARPNNVVAPLMSDFDFTSVDPGDTARCFYWTNAAHDTCIISYINLRWWYPIHTQAAATRCTFQIVLAKIDSSITFQYKRYSGTPYNGWSPVDNETGVENVTGTVGLSYLSGLVPTGNTLHETLAVKIYPPTTTSYQVTDIGILNAMNDNSGAIFSYNNMPTVMWANIKNTGNQSVGICSVSCRVRSYSGTIVYSASQTIPSMTPGEVDSINFTPAWTPTTNGLYTTIFRNNVNGDIYSPNDSVIIETRVVTYPTELYYDDSIVDEARTWTGGGGGFGNKFYPPRYPCRIIGALAAIYRDGASPVVCTLLVYKADGPGGTPGTVLGHGNVTVASTTPTFYSINVDQTINSGAFFVGAITSVVPNCTTYFCMDSALPRSCQNWEYTGSWAPDRDQSSYDVMIRAVVTLGTGVEELSPVNGNSKPIFSIYPNPFVHNTKISFVGKTKPLSEVEIYDVLGERIDKLITTKDFIIWNGFDRNGRKVSPGIYFAKLQTEDTPIIKILKLN